MMAKAKKTAAPAIIPAAEIPYTVPANWRWVRLGTVLEVSKEKTEDFSDATIKYVGLENLENGRGITSYGTAEGIKSVKNVFHPGQILYGKLRPNLNKHDIAVCDGVCSSDILVFDAKAEVDTRFANFFLDRPEFVSYAVNHSKGINLPRVSVQAVLDAAFPLPPRAEQERIVAVIEELFEKLDAAEEKLRAVVEGSPARRAALLRRAFTGDLTKNWRAAHGRTMDEWEKKNLGDCLFPQETKRPSGKTFRYIDIDAIDNKAQCVRAPKVLKTTEAPSRASRGLHPNDIVFSMVRPYLKNIAYIDSSLADCIASTGFYVCQCREMLYPRYLYYFLCAEETIHYLMQYMKGDNSPSIRKDDFALLPIPLPPLDEQKEIVRLLDELLAREEAARAAADAALAKIPALRQAVLARAFRGQLGTNDPAEPPALSE